MLDNLASYFSSKSSYHQWNGKTSKELKLVIRKFFIKVKKVSFLALKQFFFLLTQIIKYVLQIYGQKNGKRDIVVFSTL